jgi:hypothetical protein
MPKIAARWPTIFVRLLSTERPGRKMPKIGGWGSAEGALGARPGRTDG